MFASVRQQRVDFTYLKRPGGDHQSGAGRRLPAATARGDSTNCLGVQRARDQKTLGSRASVEALFVRHPCWLIIRHAFGSVDSAEGYRRRSTSVSAPPCTLAARQISTTRTWRDLLRLQASDSLEIREHHGPEQLRHPPGIAPDLRRAQIGHHRHQVQLRAQELAGRREPRHYHIRAGYRRCLLVR